MLEYRNIPPTIGVIVSTGKGTLHECETVYSVEDVYLMLEVITVDAHNRRAAAEFEDRRRNTQG